MPHRAFGSPIPVNDLESFLSVQNFVLPNAQITKPFQQFVYLPESAPSDTKLAIRSLQRDKTLFSRDVVDSMPINVKY